MTPNTTPSLDVECRVGSSVQRILLGCLGAELALVIFDVLFHLEGLRHLGPLHRIFNITREDGLASWFNSTQAFLMALTLWLVWHIARVRQDAKSVRYGWLTLASFFTYVAIDDGSKLHERVGTLVEGVKLTSTSTSGITAFFPSYPWQVVFMPIFIVFGLYAARFLWTQLNDRTMRFTMMAAFALLGVAVGFDFVEGLTSEHPWNVYTIIVRHVDLDPFTLHHFGTSSYSTLRHFAQSFEEFVEMVAITLLWSVFLRQLTRLAPSLALRFT